MADHKPTRWNARAPKPCEYCGALFKDVDDKRQRFCGVKCQALAATTPPEQRFWPKVDKSGECWIWTAQRNRAGYGCFRVSAARPMVLAHRYAMELATGQAVAEGLFVCHHCDNPPCVNPAHLFIGTAADNTRDRIQKGRLSLGSDIRLRGEQHPDAKLTSEQVRAIRESVESIPKTARRFGIGMTTVWNIRKRRTWKHLP